MGQCKSMPVRVKVIPEGDSQDKSPFKGQMTVVQAIKISRLIYDLCDSRHKCKSNQVFIGRKYHNTQSA